MANKGIIEVNNCELTFKDGHPVIKAVGVAPIGSFSWALIKLKCGYQCKRRDWSNYVILYPGDDEPSFNNKSVNDCFAISTDDGKYQPGWTPSTEDLFADDWEEV